jgi:hypothetical protein
VSLTVSGRTHLSAPPSMNYGYSAIAAGAHLATTEPDAPQLRPTMHGGCMPSSLSLSGESACNDTHKCTADLTVSPTIAAVAASLPQRPVVCPILIQPVPFNFGSESTMNVQPRLPVRRCPIPPGAATSTTRRILLSGGTGCFGRDSDSRQLPSGRLSGQRPIKMH